VVAAALEGADIDTLARAVEDHGSRAGGGFLVSRRSDGVAILLPGDEELELEELVKAIAVRLGETIRGGSGSSVAPGEVGRSLREAHYALQVCRLEGWTFAGFEDLGTYRLLLSMADPDALRAFADSLLGPLDAYDRDQHGELLPSLQAFIQHNSRWETASGGAVRPPAHAPLPDAQGRGAHRTRPVQLVRPDGVLARPPRPGPDGLRSAVLSDDRGWPLRTAGEASQPSGG
jgi:hypothetical protein